MRLADAVRAFGVEPQSIRRVGARANTHWRVVAPGGVFFLRQYRDDPQALESAAWEAALVSDLVGAGVAAPAPVAPPQRLGRRVFLLMRHLGGRKLAAGPVDDDGYRRLGRELAGLHAVVEGLPPRAQRPGWGSFVDAAAPASGRPRAGLLADLRAVAPDKARAFEAAVARFEARNLSNVFAGEPRHAIHGDFSPWNLLVRRRRLSGVLDFELAHMDVLAADLAFSRRGHHDAVVDGYRQIRSMPQPHIASLDALWLGSLLSSVWLTIEGWRRDGHATPGQLDWNLEQLGKTRPWRAVPS